MPRRARRKGRRSFFKARRRYGGSKRRRTGRSSRVTVRGRGRHVKIGPKKAVKALKQLIELNAAEKHYTDYNAGYDWPGIVIASVPDCSSTQDFSIYDMNAVAIPDGLTNLKNKEGSTIQPVRHDLHIQSIFRAQRSSNVLYGKDGRFPAPWTIVELHICQMRSDGPTVAPPENPPSGADYTLATVFDPSWPGRKKRPLWFDPTDSGPSSTRRSWRVLYKKIIKIKNPDHRPAVQSNASAAIAAGVPTGVLASASSIQPVGSLCLADTILETSCREFYQSYSLKKAHKVMYTSTSGASNTVAAGRLFFAVRAWHPHALNAYVTAPGVVPSYEDHFYPSSVVIGSRLVYMP